MDRRKILNFLSIIALSLIVVFFPKHTGFVLSQFDDHQSPSLVTVSRIVDGDTIELSNGEIVRYIGIDTPETKHPQKGVECFGPEASQKNEELVMGHDVELEFDVSETDRYGRTLAYVWNDGEMVNEQLIRQGFARVATFSPDVKYQDRFFKAEQFAREHQLGLWGGCELNEL
ncbi:hypothetical protein COX05_01475 [candidate division WWE3 bacterium CG22_combo_CG10-13_8_21_14_all_39_12]|uniref:TNase-like domain-containing protein n=2 Tax=Katanobacteria TaxID=422282 RepID=A0A2M7X008_UNCKA|nr:MAG: hypothetical protein COX05_01475 [candidate division WWE3 bacterium CG22_combo_CG10-13_8_21_14_all_39_12]PJA39285.1 MAG: hypothetical protein CO179_05610 [candidate division WWE3 bacterium CG_4_9_14_3_um_filter_39_7]